MQEIDFFESQGREPLPLVRYRTNKKMLLATKVRCLATHTDLVADTSTTYLKPIGPLRPTQNNENDTSSSLTLLVLLNITIKSSGCR